MLTVPGQKIPRKISIKVAKAEKLIETKKDGKNKKCNKFKVIILGGKHKESSPTEMSSDGNVQWRYSCIIKLHKTQNDPLVLLVEDSDGNHKGQVIIPIVKIPSKPYTYNTSQDPANSNNIQCSELEPTNKCNNPSGFLLYWVWVEEYFTEEQLGKRSFNKSMGSLFGSKSKLDSKKNLEKKNHESFSNFGSHSNLNKPEKNKKSSSFLNLKIGGKKKSKPSSSDCRITPDSSDVESSSNFSFNPAHPSNPFENDPDLVKTDRISIKNGSLAEEDSLSRRLHKFSNDSFNITKSDIPYNGNRDNLSEAQFSIKSGGDKKILSAFESISKVEKGSRQSVEEINNGKTLLMMALTANKKIPNEDSVKGSNPFKDGMVPTVEPPYTSQNLVSNNKNGNKQNNSNLVSSALPNKYNTVKDFTTHKEPPFNIDEAESTFRPSHNKSGVGSDYSIFSQYSNQLPVQSLTKVNNDESESIKKENTELKLLNTRLGQQINDLTSELDSVKQTLCKLRLKLLDEGATQFLEI